MDLTPPQTTSPIDFRGWDKGDEVFERVNLESVNRDVPMSVRPRQVQERGEASARINTEPELDPGGDEYKVEDRVIR